MIAHLTWRRSNVSAHVIKETNIYVFFKLLSFIFSCKSILPGLASQGKEGNQEHKHQVALAIYYLLLGERCMNQSTTLQLTVPRTIIKSHCLREPKASRTPNRSKS